MSVDDGSGSLKTGPDDIFAGAAVLDSGIREPVGRLERRRGRASAGVRPETDAAPCFRIFAPSTGAWRHSDATTSSSPAGGGSSMVVMGGGDGFVRSARRVRFWAAFSAFFCSRWRFENECWLFLAMTAYQPPRR